jgi:pimeloyl-ACP methyl ester carboxylesterase
MIVLLIWIVGVAAALLVLALAGLAAFTALTARGIEKRLPPPGQFIDIDGMNLHYIDEGSGPTVVMIHGLAGQHGHFVYALRDVLTEDHRVVILDRPGCGYSTRPPYASATIAAQAQTISRFIAALGLKNPLIVGHSLGGAIALSLAVNHPEQVAGLALLAPLTHKPLHTPQIFRGLAIPSPFARWLVAWTIAVPLSIKNRVSVLAAAFGPQSAPRDYATRGRGALNLRPRSFINACRDFMAIHEEQADLTAGYSGIKVPVGVLYGTADRILDPAEHQAALTAKLPLAECELIEGAGHMIPISSADRCAQFIARVAQRVAKSDASRPANVLV